MLEHYVPAATGKTPDPGGFLAALQAALETHADGPRVLILRDFHAETLIWLPDRQGLARVGLLDFQLGQAGQPGYDLVSLLQDARIDVPEQLELTLLTRYIKARRAADRQFDPAGFALTVDAFGGCVLEDREAECLA